MTDLFRLPTGAKLRLCVPIDGDIDKGVKVYGLNGRWFIIDGGVLSEVESNHRPAFGAALRRAGYGLKVIDEF